MVIALIPMSLYYRTCTLLPIYIEITLQVRKSAFPADLIHLFFTDFLLPVIVSTELPSCYDVTAMSASVLWSSRIEELSAVILFCCLWPISIEVCSCARPAR